MVTATLTSIIPNLTHVPLDVGKKTTKIWDKIEKHHMLWIIKDTPLYKWESELSIY